jgi:hypothetical protein
MEDQAKALADLTATISNMNATVTEVHTSVLELTGWRPRVELALDTIHAEVGDLRARIDDVVRSPSTSPTGSDILRSKQLGTDAPILFAAPVKPAANLGVPIASGGGDGHGQSGHRDDTNSRGLQSDDPQSSDGAPAMGTLTNPGHGYVSSEFASSSCLPPPPRVDFPLFDGENPRAWRLKCEAYFHVCSMHSDTWVSCAAMYFIDDAFLHGCRPQWHTCSSQFGRILRTPFALNLVTLSFRVFFANLIDYNKQAQ